MRLFSYHRNSAGERVRIALNLKRLAYDYVSAPALGAEYRRINPQGLMPALQVGGTIIAQSSAILEYLEEVHPLPPLLPADPLLRARIRGFAALITADLHPLNNNRVQRYLETSLGLAAAPRRAWYHHWVATGLDALEELLRRREHAWPFCFGDAPGWADLHLVPQLRNARRFDCDLVPYPLLCAIDAQCRDRPEFRLALPEHQPDYPTADSAASAAHSRPSSAPKSPPAE